MENNMQDLFVGMNSDFTTIDDKEIIDIYSSPDLLEDKWTKEKWD